MKKIGILTFQNAYNYGAALQAYALKNAIGKRAEIINYNNDHFKKVEPFFKIEKRLDKKILKIFYNNKFKKRVNKFEKFQKEFLVYDEKLIYNHNIKQIDNKYDIFITGSDQVWNLECSGGDKTYFLDFVSKSNKKNSYAASFGSGELSFNKEIVKELIKDYNNISVREKSGKEIIKNLIGREVPVVLDPTMLLTIDKWNELIGEDIIEDKYILVYTVLNGNDILEFAREISRITGFKIYYITTSLKPYKNIKCIRDAGPIEWIKFIKNAEVVLTNSFHGVVFSLIYNKNFYVELLPPPAKTNDRIKNLLEDVKLTNRVINKEFNIDDIEINYNKVNIELNKMRKESVNFLNTIIE